MGTFVYGPTLTLEIDDHTLAHLQAVIGAKLRRGESMFFTWREPSDGERLTLWLHPTMPLGFRYSDIETMALNWAWVQTLMVEANKPAGLQVVDEPDRSAASSTPEQ